ncbi:hypothetical protein BSY18_4138 (plasmid) [Blastomonas sp. RAC04]|uniref:hypothetical protein n=1 Tax=Blastomonas sp. RAC04 TaxID=1842535 RepID=UPI000855F409|nr:hypothetical protein [Blastomonas sp. RAC04]AOG02536.1 hypothetical protein BSY18_4138 [Blastomonas sp. RAC04]
MSALDLSTINQHQLIEAVFCACRGTPVDDLLPPGYKGKKADIVFSDENVIAEIKSLTSDRATDETVSAKLGSVLEEGVAFGAPVIFGTTTINVNDLPRTVAERAVRVLGRRARKEVTSAARQIEQTRSILRMPDAYGLVVFISPAHIIGQQTLRWLIHDLLQQRGNFAGLDGALLIQTPLCFGDRDMRFGNTYSSLWSISNRPFPEQVGDAISEAWNDLTGQSPQPSEYEAFARNGMTE